MNVREMFGLKGKVAVVTGGSIGLGREIAHGLAEAGADLVLCARKKERCTATAEEIRRKHGVKVLSLGCDVSREEDVKELAAKSIAEFKSVDILVNNAGITWGSLPEDMPASDWQKVLDVNLNGTFFCCKHFGKAMIARRSGCIINSSSIMALQGETILSAPSYSTSKGGIISLTRELAVQWSKYGIRINAVAPGFFKTSMTAPALRKHEDSMRQRIPLGRFGGEDDLKGVIVFLASPASSFITGQTIVVDGGETSK